MLTGAASLNTNGANGNASLTNARATVLGASDVGGNLAVTASAGISLTQTGRADGRRHVVVHDLGRERSDHPDATTPTC